MSPTDPRGRQPRAALRMLAALLVLGPVTLAVAATHQPVSSPHGSYHEDCGLCHGAGDWKTVKISPKFDHAKRSGFALDGAHRTAACTSCHTSLDFKQSRTQCASCHEDVHRGEMGPDCARCHSPRSFVDRSAMTRMHQLTRFPLIGGHAGLDCESCHPPAAQGHLQYVGTQAECSGCHRTDYNNAKIPDHVAGSFPLACENCHSQTTWNAARFDHSQTAFPLTGAHRSVACAQCHGDGVYKGKSTACASCHTSDYNATTNPAHAAAGFANTCADCHTTVAWTGATFNHDGPYFPIYSGAHAGRWNRCTDCHNVPSSYAQFTCLTCHQQAETDGHHTAVSGYSYNSNACYSCHPQGRH